MALRPFQIVISSFIVKLQPLLLQLFCHSLCINFETHFLCLPVVLDKWSKYFKNAIKTKIIKQNMLLKSYFLFNIKEPLVDFV